MSQKSRTKMICPSGNFIRRSISKLQVVFHPLPLGPKLTTLIKRQQSGFIYFSALLTEVPKDDFGHGSYHIVP